MTIAKHCGIGGNYIKRNHTYSALSRCNGMGSFKMTIAAANNQRASPYNNEQRRLSQSNARNSNVSAIGPVLNSGNEEMHKDDDHYRQRFVSVSSQSTLLTTISKNDTNGVVTMKSGDCGINNNVDAKSKSNAVSQKQMRNSGASSSRQAHMSSQANQNPSTLGTIAEKLRRRVMLFKTNSNSSQGGSSSNAANDDTTQGEERHRDGRKLEKGNSIDSANTISNSSLQEVDDDEFDSNELAKYMGQINNEIR